MANPSHSTPFRLGVGRLASLGQIMPILAIAGLLALLISAPAGRWPSETTMQSAPHKQTEDWRGNSAGIRPYAE
jgi:hypothetical protein